MRLLQRSPYRVLLPSLRAHGRPWAGAMMAATGAQALGIPLALVVREIFNRTASGRTSDAVGPSLAIFAGVLAALVLLRAVLRWIEVATAERFAQRVLADIRQRMYAHLQRVPQGYFERKRIGSVLVRFVGDAGSLRSWLARTLITVPADLLTLAAVAVALAWVHPHLAYAAFLPAVPLAGALLLLNPRARRWTREGRRRQARLSGMIAERLDAMAAIKAGGAQVDTARGVDDMIDGVRAAQSARGRVDAWAKSISIAATSASVCAVGLWGTWLHGQDAAAAGDILAAIWVAVIARGPVNRLTQSNVVHQRARVAAERVARLLEREPEPGWDERQRPYDGPGLRLRLRGVGYRSGRSAWLFRGVDETITGPALVGFTDPGSGAGSAMFELILRLRRPHEGRLGLDRNDLRKVRVNDLRRRVGWLDRDRRGADVLRLLTGDGAGPDWLERAWRHTPPITPGTMDDLLGALRRRGARLDAASSLRLGLAFAMQHDPPVVLLDDPGRGLAPDAAAALRTWLAATSSTRMVLIATRDPRLLEHCGRVITLEDTAAGARSNAAPQRQEILT